MPNFNLRNILDRAQKNKYAIGQFNFSTLEQLRGILSAARKLESPIIVATSERESNYIGLKEAVALVEISKVKYRVVAFLNFDHGKNLDKIKTAIDYGYSAVHFDGSELPLEKNIKYTKKVVEYAHKRGVLVEGELGYLRGESKLHKGKGEIRKKDLTSPEEAEEFVRKTKVDSLAIAIGNIHGIYAKMPKIDFRRLEEIHRKTKVFLVLHGGSGISKPEIKKAIKKGIVKININTELREVWKKALFTALKTSTIKPYEILPPVQTAVQKKVEEKINLFGSKNKI